MKELSTELKQRLEEAAKDREWAEKVRGVGSREAYEELLKEKGIVLPADVKDAFAADGSVKTGELADQELENVTGGWVNIFSCPREYNLALCEWTFCPHRHSLPNTPDEDHYEQYCDLGYWRQPFTYPPAG